MENINNICKIKTQSSVYTVDEKYTVYTHPHRHIPQSTQRKEIKNMHSNIRMSAYAGTDQHRQKYLGKHQYRNEEVCIL